jgi:hypothetical protein
MTRFTRLIVWAGGAIFVLSLAACAYAYAWRWAAPPPAPRGGIGGAVAIDAVLFAVFALHHSLFARESIKTRVARVVPADLMRSFYVWIASLLLLALLAFWQPVAADLYAPPISTPSPAGARRCTPPCNLPGCG